MVQTFVVEASEFHMKYYQKEKKESIELVLNSHDIFIMQVGTWEQAILQMKSVMSKT